MRILFLFFVFLNGCQSARLKREREYAQKYREYELYRISELEQKASQDPEEVCAGRDDKADCFRVFEIRMQQLNMQVDRLRQKHRAEDEAAARARAAQAAREQEFADSLTTPTKSWGHHVLERKNKKTRCKSKRTWDGEVETVCE